MPISEIPAAELPEQIRSFVARMLPHYPTKRAVLIPTLMECQKYYGHITPEVAMGVSKLLDVPYGEVQSCLSFYTMLHTRPTGKYAIGACRTLNCELGGAAELIEHFLHRYGVEPFEVTEDGNFMLYEVECLCDCHNAPSFQIVKAGPEFKSYWVNNLTAPLLDRILDELAAGQEDALRERLVRITEKQNPPDDRKWLWIVTTNNQYPTWVELKDGEYAINDAFGKFANLKNENPVLYAELQMELKNTVGGSK
jgi:NADH-quinone oxidoreductase subunit E